VALLSSSQTIVRYQAGSIKDEKIMETIQAALIKNAMPEVQEEYQEMMVGWVPFEKPYDPNFKIHPYIYGTDFVFSLRIDKKTVPAKALAQKISVAVQAKCEATGREFLSKNEKADIKEIVLEKLILQVPFVPAIHEVHWNYESGSVMFFSNNKAANELFETLFIASFERKIFQLFPYALAAGSINQATIDMEVLDQLTPSTIGIGGAV